MSPNTVATASRLSPAILVAGLVTSVAALALEYGLSAGAGFSLMGLYMMFVLPVGALLVGGLAGSGYGIGSWRTGTRISGPLMVVVVALQLVVYFVARYIAFASFDPPLVFEDGTRVGFLLFLDLTAQSMAFEDGDPLEAWGYLFTLLEVAGFAAGGLFGVALMRGKPYCEACQRYMQTSTLLWLPLSPAGKPPGRKATVGETDEWERASSEAFEDGHALAKEVFDGAVAADLAAYESARAAHAGSQKDITKSPLRLVIGLQHCKGCQRGSLTLNQHAGQGDQLQNEFVGVAQLPPEAVRGLAG